MNFFFDPSPGRLNLSPRDMTHLSDQFAPTRGDLVVYQNDLYYFQPNGTSCYLYHRRSDIGQTHLAAFKPSLYSLRKPSAADIAKKVQITTKASESPRDPIDVLTEKVLEMRLKNVSAPISSSLSDSESSIA